MTLTIDDVMGWIDDVFQQYQREEDQGILQGRLDKAMTALTGKDACERLKRDIQMRYGMQQNRERVQTMRKRA